MTQNIRLKALGSLFVLLAILLALPSLALAEEAEGYSYVNLEKGFKLEVPQELVLDDSLKAVRTVFASENTRLEIYMDDFTDTVHSAASYQSYSNLFLRNTRDHLRQVREVREIKGRSVQLLKWQREKLPALENDKNYYLSAEIVASPKRVYTLLFKSDEPLKNEMQILESFQAFQSYGEAKLPRDYIKISPGKKYSPEAKELLEDYFGKSAPQRWGIFEPTAPLEMETLKALEERVEHEFSTLVLYQGLNDFHFPREAMDNAAQAGKIVQLTFQTYYQKGDNRGVLYAILRGDYDKEIERYAQEIKDFGKPILFRLNNEMNGDWCPYSSYHHSKDTDIFIAVWRYFYDKFQEEGADNLLWVWNPNGEDMPGFAWNNALLYYPGDEYVDIVGLTAYNTGTYYRGEKWTSFDDLYRPLYFQYANLSAKPLMITEFGSSSSGGDKIAWLQDMFTRIPKYPRLKQIIWWNGIDWDGTKPARIYRLDESEEMLEVFKEGLGGF